MSADPLGQIVPGGEAEIVPGGEAEAFLALGMPLGSQGLGSSQCEQVEASYPGNPAIAFDRADLRSFHGCRGP